MLTLPTCLPFRGQVWRHQRRLCQPGASGAGVHAVHVAAAAAAQHACARGLRQGLRGRCRRQVSLRCHPVQRCCRENCVMVLPRNSGNDCICAAHSPRLLMLVVCLSVCLCPSVLPSARPAGQLPSCTCHPRAPVCLSVCLSVSVRPSFRPAGRPATILHMSPRAVCLSGSPSISPSVYPPAYGPT
jgi:hypothetical protein